MMTINRILLLILVCCCCSFITKPAPIITDPNAPYKVLTTGNQVTIRCSRDIKTVMAWNSGGNRILEKSPHAAVFSFRVPTTQKLIFIRIQLEDGKIYSEKVGLRN